jgi:hypothetical protein
MEVLDKIRTDVDVLVKTAVSKLHLSFDIEDYLFQLYFDNEINGFSAIEFIGNLVKFEVQKPGERGSDGWVEFEYQVDTIDKTLDAYERAMRGI